MPDATPMRDALTGRCLCGAVTVQMGPHKPAVGVCHCSRCRRWTGSALFALSAEDFSYTGPVTIWDHKIAERAFCSTCGTLLWFKNHDGAYEPQVGLFDAAKDYSVVSEIYTDRAFAAVDLAGSHTRRTEAEFEADHPHVEEAP